MVVTFVVVNSDQSDDPCANVGLLLKYWQRQPQHLPVLYHLSPANLSPCLQKTEALVIDNLHGMGLDWMGVVLGPEWELLTDLKIGGNWLMMNGVSTTSQL